ncbi:MAG: hypothetical protein ACRDTU_16250 [Micromonosporaceae bacterium]
MAGYHRQRKRTRRAERHQEPPDDAASTTTSPGDSAAHQTTGPSDAAAHHSSDAGPDAGDPPADDGDPGGTTAHHTPQTPDPATSPGRPTPATVAAAHRGRDAGVLEPAQGRDAGVPEPARREAVRRREAGIPGPDDAVPRAYQAAASDVPEPPAGSASTAAVVDPEDEAPAVEREPERGLRGLVGSGTSQVGVSSATRARDAARPTPADLARAEQDLVIVRRNWVPREPFRPSGPQRRRRDGPAPR